MRSVCIPALLTATLLLLPCGIRAAAASNQAQYMFGTVQSIPTNAVGLLDLSDPADLQFRFGKENYRVPYRQIKSFQLSNAKTAGRTIAHVPVPKLPFHSRARMLDLSFFDARGAVGTLSFRLTGRDVSSAEWMLTEKIREDKESAQAGSRSKLPEAWWGDRFWKTARNKGTWPDASTESLSSK